MFASSPERGSFFVRNELPLAKPETLRLHQKLYRHAKGAPLGELTPQAAEGVNPLLTYAILYDI